MRVLITGGGGFLGKCLARMLIREGYAVRILGRKMRPELEREGFEYMVGDIANPDDARRACTNMEAVFHVAAHAGVWGRWEDYYRPNVLGTRHIIDACRERGVHYLVYTSTPSVVFNRSEFTGEDEGLPYGSRWLCHYAHTKAIAEEEALAAHDESRLNVLALRPHLIWGPGDPHIVPRLVERARTRKLVQIGDGSNRVDITYVDNAAYAHIQGLKALLRGQGGGRAYFIGQEEPVLLWKWINDLLQRLGEPQIERRLARGNAYMLGAVCEALWMLLPLQGEPPMTRFLAVEMGKSHYFDISAARRELGYQPLVTTEDGLERLVRSMRG